MAQWTPLEIADAHIPHVILRYGMDKNKKDSQCDSPRLISNGVDKVFIENLTLRGIHGVYEFEWKEPQEFVIDISIETDLSRPAKSDDLADTVDWQPMYKIAKEVIEGPRISLIEKIADTIATRILQNEKITSASVKVRKNEILDDGVPGVLITRTR